MSTIPLCVKHSNSWFALLSLTSSFYYSLYQYVNILLWSCCKGATLRECAKTWSVENCPFYPSSQCSTCLIDHLMHRARHKVLSGEIVFIKVINLSTGAIQVNKKGILLKRWSDPSNCTELCFLKFGPPTTCIRITLQYLFKRNILGPHLTSTESDYLWGWYSW